MLLYQTLIDADPPHTFDQVMTARMAVFGPYIAGGISRNWRRFDWELAVTYSGDLKNPIIQVHQAMDPNPIASMSYERALEYALEYLIEDCYGGEDEGEA